MGEGRRGRIAWRAAVFVTAVLPTLAGCGAMSRWGVLSPEYPRGDAEAVKTETDVFKEYKADPFLAYVQQRMYALDLMSFYDGRALFNRGALYAGSTAVLGVTAASSGLAAFGAAASGAGKSLPIVGTFINGLFGIFDNRQHAQLYTDAANDLRTLVAEKDAAFLREPDSGAKLDKVDEMKREVAKIVNRVEAGRTNLAPGPEKTLEVAAALKDRVEEAARIKPKITDIAPVVLRENLDRIVTILGSGFDEKTEVLLDAEKVPTTFISNEMIHFKAAAGAGPKAFRVVVRNGFGRSAEAPIRLVRANLEAAACGLKDHPDPAKRKSHSVIEITGRGFFSKRDGGSVEVRKKDGSLIKPFSETWQGHQRWELVIPREAADSPLGSVTVINRADTDAQAVTKDLTGNGLASCATVPAKQP